MIVDKIVKKVSFLYSNNAETPTDFDLTLSVLDRLHINWEDQSLRFFDPACGRGTFLLAVLKRLEPYHTREHIITNMLYGADINSAQVNITQQALKLACNTKSNVFCFNSIEENLKMKFGQFDYLVGNYPFNDDSESAGRDTNKVKENTKSLDHEFYKKMLPVARNHAVILRSNCLGKDSSVRQSIFTDSHVKEIIDTTGYFTVAPGTMCVIRDEQYDSNIKTITDRNGDSFTITTDRNTKLSLTAGSRNIGVIQTIWTHTAQSNMCDLWLRSPIKRTDTLVNDTDGVPFVPITGDRNKDLEIKRYSGDVSKVKSLDKWKVITNVNAGQTSIGAIKIVPPGTATSNSIVYFPFDTETEAKNCKAYLESSFIRWYTPLAKVSAGNSSEFFAKVPTIDFTKEFVEDLVKDLFSKDEQALIWTSDKS
jgi:hypothetical protein